MGRQARLDARLKQEKKLKEVAEIVELGERFFQFIENSINSLEAAQASEKPLMLVFTNQERGCSRFEIAVLLRLKDEIKEIIGNSKAKVVVEANWLKPSPENPIQNYLVLDLN